MTYADMPPWVALCVLLMVLACIVVTVWETIEEARTRRRNSRHMAEPGQTWVDPGGLRDTEAAEELEDYRIMMDEADLHHRRGLVSSGV